MSTSRASTPESSISFHTARDSPMTESDDVDSMSNGEPPLKQTYRPAIETTEAVRQHCHVFLDEQLYEQALILLSDLVTVGASHPASSRGAFAPLPSHIELVSAMLIHPRYTNQAPTNEQQDLPSRSIKLLRNLLAILGPLNANLVEAFSFSDLSIGKRTSRRSRNVAESAGASSDSESDQKSERVKGIIAGEGRLRRCAKDFWHVVGWAFNCSVKYPNRWKYWKVWLDYMLDVLDADWVEREQLQSLKDSESEDSKGKSRPNLLEQSILMSYLSEAKSNSNAMKRVVSSAFADGGPISLKAFPEVFPNETKELKPPNGQKRKRADTMDQAFGEYDDEQASPSELTDHSNESGDENNGAPVIDPWIGGAESIALRQRVISLLSRAFATSQNKNVKIYHVYDEIDTCARRLPLPAWSLLLSPCRSSYVPTIMFVTLSQFILCRFTSAGPLRAREPGREGDSLSQTIIERCYLPAVADTSSVADNAKASILLENILRLFLRKGQMVHTPSLEEAIEKGIEARESQVRGRRKANRTKIKKEESDMAWLKASGQRLRSLGAWVEHNGG